MAKASNRVPLTLCCAQEDASHIRPVLTHLERQDGYKVRLIEGVEEDPYLLGSTLDRQLGACVIIACLSDALGPSQFRRIEGVYNARKGPQHYLDTIFVEPDETLAMAESVRGVVTKARGKLAASAKPKPKPDPAASSSAHRMRDVVGVTTLSAVGTDAIASPNAALGTSESKLSLGKPAPITEAAAAQSQAAQSQQPQAAQSQNAQSPNTQSQSMSAASSQLMFEAAKRKNPGWVAPILFLIFLAVAGTVVLLLLLQQQQNDDGITQRGAPGLNNSTGQGDKAPEGETKQAAAKADESQTAAGQAGGESETGDEAGESESESESETGESEAAAPEGDGDESEADRIVEAIQNGEMRAVDLILIAKTSELSAWRDAANRCRSKSVNGVRSWRLPTLDELKTIRKARMVERDRYWSSTLATQVGTGTDHVYVLDLAERSIAPMSKETPDVRVICVRPALKN